MADLSIPALELAPSACVLWEGKRDRHGYGVYWRKHRRVYAHRRAWEDANGRTLVAGEVVCHRCDTPACFNPAHLWVGTQRDNMLDMWRKGRGKVSRALGERAHLAKLTVAQAAAIAVDGRPTSTIAREYGVGVSAVRCIRTGKTWAEAIAAYRGGK